MKRTNRRILCMGPLLPPYTGQAVAFTSVVEEIQKTNECIVIDIANKDKWLNGIVLCLSIVAKVLFFKFDCVYFTCSRTKIGSIRDVVLLLCARIRGLRVINHLHGADYKSFFSSLPTFYQKIVYWSYSYIDTGIVLLDEMKSEFDSYKNMNIKVVHNFYSSSFDQLPVYKQLSDGDKVQMLYFSNLMKTKGILNLLDAAMILLDKYENLYLSVAGEIYGDYELPLEKMKIEVNERFDCLSSKYPDRFKYYGVCTGTAKTKLFWNSDVFLLPTFYITEAVPLTLIEAMRSGNYLITTNHNYIPGIVSEDFGDLISPDSVEAIVFGMDKFYKSRAKYHTISNHNINFAIENYSENSYLQNVLEIIFGK